MSSWESSWKDVFAAALLKEIWNPSQSKLLSLPPELLQQIAILGFPGDPYHNCDSLVDMCEYIIMSRTSSALRDAPILDVGFCEGFFKFILNRQFGIGRPLGFKEQDWTWMRIAMKIAWDFAVGQKGMCYLALGSRIRDLVKELPDPKTYETEKFELYSEQQIGRLISEWEPAVFDKVLDDSEVQGKLISIHTPHHTVPSSDMIPLSMTHPRLLPLNSYPEPKDISIGMTFTSSPALTKVTVYVEMGRLPLGEFVVENAEGVTYRDYDRKLAEAIDRPFDQDLQAKFKDLVPDCDFANVNAVTIRDVIFIFADPDPSLLPCIMSGKTSVRYVTKTNSSGHLIMSLYGHSLWGLFGGA